jgi:aconitate hydratase
MTRGTFANVRIKTTVWFRTPTGGVTRHFGAKAAEDMSIFDAAMAYKEEGIPLIVLAGQEYGTGSSRDWAAKGTALFGCKSGRRTKLRTYSSFQSRRHGSVAPSV